MRLLLLSQGSQGLVALRTLFENGVSPRDIIVRVCEEEDQSPFCSFLNYMKMPYSIIRPGENLLESLRGISLTDHMLVSIGWKFRVSKKVLESVKLAINFHPGLLPRYSGCFSTPWSIINGEDKCGYTFHFMDEEFDTGNILFKKEFDVQPEDNAFTLNYRIVNHALSYLYDVICLAQENEGQPQIGERCYYPNRLPYDGVIPRGASFDLAERIKRATYFPPFPEAKYELP